MSNKRGDVDRNTVRLVSSCPDLALGSPTYRNSVVPSLSRPESPESAWGKDDRAFPPREEESRSESLSMSMEDTSSIVPPSPSSSPPSSNGRTNRRSGGGSMLRFTPLRGRRRSASMERIKGSPAAGAANAAHQSQQVRRHSSEASSARPLKSCMSVSNLSDSLKGINNSSKSRTVSAPDLATMNSGTPTPASGNTFKRSVSFHKIVIREYERTVGDNPSVSSGPPIGIGWSYDPQHSVLDVDEYEATRPARRSSIECKMPPSIRERLLREEWGYARSDITKAIRDVNIHKSKRRSTTSRLEMGHDAVDEVVQSAVRKVKKFVKRTSSKKEQEKLWKNAQKIALEKAEKGTAGGDHAVTLDFDDTPFRKKYQRAVRFDHEDMGTMTMTPHQDNSSNHDNEDAKKLPLNDTSSGLYDTETSSSSTPNDMATKHNNDSITLVPTIKSSDSSDDDWGFGYDERD